MIRTIATGLLLISTTCFASDGNSDMSTSAHGSEDALTAEGRGSDENALSDSDLAPTSVSAIEPTDRTEGSTEPNDAEMPVATRQLESVVEPITLDELLRQVRKTPHLKHDSLLARLAERKRLATALRATLEAADQVAEFGDAGAQLLRDASLDTIVATMIEERERERSEQALKTAQTAAKTSKPEQSTPEERVDAKNEQDTSEFEAWRLVYIVQDVRGHRVGWRRLEDDERAVTYVGERWEVGSDVVSVVAVATDRGGRYVVIDLNGERREVHLY